MALYAWVLIDLNVANKLLALLNLERDNHVFSVDIVHEDLSKFCRRYGFLGHVVSACRKKEKAQDAAMAFGIRSMVIFPFFFLRICSGTRVSYMTISLGLFKVFRYQTFH